MQQVASGMVLEGLISYRSDGRGTPMMAREWSVSDDGLHIRVTLRSGLTFHDGNPVTALAVRDALRNRLRIQIGSIFDDVAGIEAVSDDVIEIALKQRSRFVLEGLDVPIQVTGKLIGAGPFQLDGSAEGDVVRLRAFDRYHGGRSLIDKVEIRPYGSIRSAWADLLRGNLDMLYEVGADAIDSLRPSSATRVFRYTRRYVLLGIFNTSRPALKSPEIRRRLNAAIDRQTLVAEVLHGLGVPAEGPVWPNHWAYDPALPGLSAVTTALADQSQETVRLKLIFADAAFERVVLFLQQQLRRANVEIEPELVSLDRFGERAQAGDFDILLGDAAAGPAVIRTYHFWHSRGTTNFGHFKSAAVDSALDHIRNAIDDDAYRAGVANLQRAVIDDPPAIFLAWSQRARAVSTRFDVHEEPGRDILSTLRLWKPAGRVPTTSPPN
jgi:peptide/nickel transport system substrate-binding protein